MYYSVKQWLFVEGRGEFGDVMVSKIPKSVLINNKRHSKNSQTTSDDAQTEDKEVHVLIKALNNTKDEVCLQEFKREMDLFNKFSHENITKLFGLCREAEPHFMILEHTDWVNKFPLNPRSRCN